MRIETIHDFYLQCLGLNFSDTYPLMKEAKSQDEKEFIRMISDFVLQKKQEKAVVEKRF